MSSLKKKEITFVLIKPDGFIHKSKISGIISKTKLGIIYADDLIATKKQIFDFYNKSDDWLSKYGAKIVKTRSRSHHHGVDVWLAKHVGETIIPAIADYMAYQPMFGMLVEGIDAVSVMRDLIVNTEPRYAEKNSIRSQFSTDCFDDAWRDEDGPRAIKNVIHSSDSEHVVCREALNLIGHSVKKFFPEQ